MKGKNQLITLIICIVLGLVLRFFVVGNLLEGTENPWVQGTAIALMFIIGIGYVFRSTANVIEETTDVLSRRTKLAGGLLQSFGTAFPDMVIGVVAALLSLSARGTDPVRAINLAVIAASTTFGSNIYNILFATWCIWRQNVADHLRKNVLMFPSLAFGGALKPLHEHQTMPSLREMDGAIRILTALTWLTAFAAISMVLFGKVQNPNAGGGDLYQLVMPIGVLLFALCVWVLYHFRKSHRADSSVQEVVAEEHYYARQKTLRIWLDLVLAGIAILLVAESMVKSLEVFSRLTHIPLVVTGIVAALVGCFGEMLVIHNFSVHPNGRIGDAIVGVAMDNIVTTLGAAIVAIMGGIFLGGNSLILIFIIILASNTLLIEQISKLKNSLR